MNSLVGRPYWIGVVFFFVGFSPGMWMPALPNVLSKMGHESWIPWIYMGMPLGSIISPFILGALSDGKVAANRLCGYAMLAGGGTMTVAFTALHYGVPIEVFVVLMLINSLLSAPLWALATQSALAFLTGREERFAYYRVFGTIGWLAAGMIGGLYLGADESAHAGILGGVLRFPVGLICFLMPHCEPVAKGKSFSILQMMGQGSRELWLDRNVRVLFISAGLIAIPLSAFFMYCPLQMQEMGVDKPTAWMSLSQWFELPAMLTLTWACARFNIKWLVGFGLLITAVRQALFWYSAQTGQFWPMTVGFLTHGLTYSYFLTVAQVNLEKGVRKELRGRAQGMLSLIFGGIGSFLGVMIIGRLQGAMVPHGTLVEWQQFWLVLTVMALFPTLYFYWRYQK